MARIKWKQLENEFNNEAYFTGSFNVTGSVSASFLVGDGSQITNIDAGNVVGLNLSRIATGSVSASVALQDNIFSIVSSSSNLLTVSSSGDVNVSNNLTVAGIITAQEFHTELVSASIIYESGSTKFGDTFDDTHQFTGSILSTGSITSDYFYANENFFLDNIDVLNFINTSGVFRVTGSYASATSDIKITGSLDVELDGTEDVITIAVSGSEVLRVNEEGVLVLNPFYTTPTAITGGIMYSGSNEFFIGL